MNQNVLDFLTMHRVSVMSILQDDGTVHAAALHFAYRDNPFQIFVSTGKDSRKARPLVSGKTVPASIVIGFEESEFTTFQADGTIVSVTDPAELDAGWAVYGQKYPDRIAWRDDPAGLFLRFTPTWWRYTEMKEKPATVISSEK